jgi:hypothetical protein
MSNERRDFIAAFIMGAVIGAGTTALLKPPSRKKRLRLRGRRGRALRRRLRTPH